MVPEPFRTRQWRRKSKLQHCDPPYLRLTRYTLFWLSYLGWLMKYILHHHHYHHHWRNSPIWAQAFLRSFRQPSLFLAAFLQFFSPYFLAPSITPSFHLSFGLPFCLFPSTTAARTLLAGLCSSNRITCPAQWNILLNINLTTFVLEIELLS